MTAGELSNLTGLTTGAVTGLIDRFEKKKLVKRQFAEDDRRKVIIVPNTENIMALLAPLYKEFRSKSEKLFDSFSNKEIKILETYFLKAIEIMNETTNRLNNNTSMARQIMKMKNMSSYILGFKEIDKTKLAIVGGKGANLGEFPGLKGYECQMVFVSLLQLKKNH